MNLPDALLALLVRPSPCYLSTTMPDGSPQLTQTWVDTDGDHVVINTVEGFQKVRNVERDPRVAVAVADPDDPHRYFQVRGRVVSMTTQGAAEHIDSLSRRYLGTDYPWFGGRQQTRIMLLIEADSVTGTG